MKFKNKEEYEKWKSQKILESKKKKEEAPKHIEKESKEQNEEMLNKDSHSNIGNHEIIPKTNLTVLTIITAISFLVYIPLWFLRMIKWLNSLMSNVKFNSQYVILVVLILLISCFKYCNNFPSHCSASNK